VNFAKGRLKMIFYVFLISFICNLAGNVTLIPFFKAEGAAAAYLVAIIAQSVIYLKKTTMEGLQAHSYRLLLSPLAAVAASLSAAFLFNTWWINLLLAPAFYIGLLYLTKQIRPTDWAALKRVTHL
jgi:O-antigen/teichoic acid export membrane protein